MSVSTAATSWCRALLPGVLLLAAGACGPEEEERRARVVVTATTPTTVRNLPFLDGVGEVAEILVQVTDADGKPGQGSITLVATGGQLDGNRRHQLVALQNGEVRAAFACDVATDSVCATGRVSVRATWSDAASGRTIYVGETGRVMLEGPPAEPAP